mgnify:CR=1 FL=1
MKHWLSERLHGINEIEDRVFIGILPGLLLAIGLYIHYYM